MAHRGRRHRAPDDGIVAGNGLLNRRLLLRQGLTIAGASAAVGATGAAAEPLKDDEWSLRFGDITPALQVPSRHEARVTRTLSNPRLEPKNSHGRTPHQMLGGMTTPNSLHFSINHHGIPDIDPEKHRLVIHGAVRQPLEFSLEKLSRFPLVTRMAFLECAGNSGPMYSSEPVQASLQALHGLASNAEWTGVRLSHLLDEAGADLSKKWIIAEGADAGMLYRSIPMKKALDDALVVVYQNGERLMPGNGYPMRLLVPGYQGNMNVKFLRRLKVVDQPGMSYFETRKYSQILPGGKSWRFHFLMEVKSFISAPSFGHRIEPGYTTISGVAWSGAGRISKVMVSADGGKSYAEAALVGAPQDKAFTRFMMPWRWDGRPAVIQSRAWDENGNVQPTRTEFVAMRGQTDKPLTTPDAFPSQHFNAITSWGVNANGEVSHVYA